MRRNDFDVSRSIMIIVEKNMIFMILCVQRSDMVSITNFSICFTLAGSEKTHTHTKLAACPQLLDFHWKQFPRRGPGNHAARQRCLWRGRLLLFADPPRLTIGYTTQPVVVHQYLNIHLALILPPFIHPFLMELADGGLGSERCQIVPRWHPRKPFTFPCTNPILASNLSTHTICSRFGRIICPTVEIACWPPTMNSAPQTR